MAKKTLKRNTKLFGPKGAKAPKVEDVPKGPPKVDRPLLAVCTPLEDRVVIEIDQAIKKIGSIVLPDAATDKPQTGTIISIGPGRKDKDGNTIPMNVAKGERVIFAKYAGMSLEGTAVRDGEQYIMLRENDVLAKIPKDA